MSFGRGSARVAPTNDFGDKEKGNSSFGRGSSTSSFGIARTIGGGGFNGFSSRDEDKNDSYQPRGGGFNGFSSRYEDKNDSYQPRGGGGFPPRNDTVSGDGFPSRGDGVGCGFPPRNDSVSGGGFPPHSASNFGNHGRNNKKNDVLSSRNDGNDVFSRSNSSGGFSHHDKKNTDNGFTANKGFGRNCQDSFGGSNSRNEEDSRFGRSNGLSNFGHDGNTSSFGRGGSSSNFGFSRPSGGGFDKKHDGFSRRGENKNGSQYGGSGFSSGNGVAGGRSNSGFPSHNGSNIQDRNGHKEGGFFSCNNSDDVFSRSNGGFGRDKKNTQRNNGFDQNRQENFGNFSNDNKNENFDGAKDFVNTGPSHVPRMRAIDDIFQEDTNAAENYMQIRADDDNVVVTPNLDTIAVVDKWDEADLEPSLMENIYRANYSVPRKIQSYTIPIIMEGMDVKGHAETGSGKTAAFLIPIINTIIKKKAAGEFTSRRSHPYALIIEPTRELAIQLYDQARKLTHETGVSVAVAYGKYRVSDNLREISLGCDILVGTPGRLRDFITKSYVLMVDLKVLVLDEADRLLEDEFMIDIRSMTSSPNFPEKNKRQTLLFSATFTPDVQKWADEILREQNVMVSNQKFASANSKVVQNFMLVHAEDKKDQLIKLLKGELEEKQKELSDGQTPRLRRTLIFVQKRRDADVLSAYLCQENIKATTINGDRTQKMREESLEKFRNDEVDVVVSTDVCARGIDIKDLDHVINFDLPIEAYVTYIHRIGRTGRLKQGMATTFFDPSTDSMLAKDLVAGVRETGQMPPEFLIEASENRLIPPVKKEEDQAWGIYPKSAGFPVYNKPKSFADNEDW